MHASINRHYHEIVLNYVSPHVDTVHPKAETMFHVDS